MSAIVGQNVHPGEAPADPPREQVDREWEAVHFGEQSHDTIVERLPDQHRLLLPLDANQFLVFRDADTQRLGVIYKRKDGNYGLIEP